jgi:phosphoribosylformylglycinamidine cyclo-ligase
MRGFYAPGHFDLAGFGVGMVDRTRIVDGSAISEGDVVIGLDSSGLHSNGYSLVRRVLLEDHRMALDSRLDGETDDLATVLLRPTRIYTRVAAALLREVDVHGIAHITGGGLPDNIRRLLPEGLGVEIDASAWTPSNIFAQIARLGPVERNEMFRTFNMGIGFAVIVAPDQAKRALAICREHHEKVHEIGSITSGKQDVTIR